jgi:hypothetical protein
MFKRHRIKKTIQILQEHPIPIVADAAIATERMGDGRLIPLVILDTTNRPDLEEFIRIHAYAGPGDADSQWASLQDSSGRVALLLTFKKPMEMTAILAFDSAIQGGLVDQIIHSRGLYIQAGREGDRFIKNPDAPKVIIEIPDTGFAEVWDELFFRAVVQRMRQQGLTRREAKQAARSYITDWRKFGSFRMKDRGPRAAKSES